MPIICSDDISHTETVKGLRNVKFSSNHMRMNEREITALPNLVWKKKGKLLE